MLDRLNLARTLVTVLVLVLGTALIFHFGDQSPIVAAVTGLFGLVVGWWFPSDGVAQVPRLTILTDRELDQGEYDSGDQAAQLPRFADQLVGSPKSTAPKEGR